MIPPVVCFSCGCSLNMYSEIYERIRTERLRKKLGDTKPRFASIDPATQVDMQDVLDKLNIPRDCCRMRLATSMTWQDYF